MFLNSRIKWGEFMDLEQSLNPFIERNPALIVLSSKCILHNDFTLQKGLTQEEILHLASNIIHYEKGYETLLSYVKPDKLKTWIGLLDAVKQMNLPASSCTSKNCRYINDCRNCGNILSKLNVRKGKVISLVDKQKKSLKDAEVELEQKFLEFLGSEPAIKILKAPTGIGKTELYVKYAKPKTWYCVPTHALRKEVVERLIVEKNKDIKALYKKKDKTESEQIQVDSYINSVLENNDWIMTIGEIPFLNEEFNNRVNELEQAGSYRKAKKLVSDKAKELKKKENEGIELTKAEKSIIRYDRDRKEMFSTEKIVVITHAKLLYTNECPAETIIIDEDIITSLIQIKNISLRDIRIVMEQIKGDSDIKEKEREHALRHTKAAFKFLSNLVEGVITEIPPRLMSGPIKDIILKNIRLADVKTDVLDFLNSKFVLKEVDGDNLKINYVSKADLTEITSGINTIILSATINPIIWKHYLNENPIYHDIGLVEGIGSVIQYPQKSFSRSYITAKDIIDPVQKLNAIQERFKFVKDKIGDMPVISYSICQDLEHLKFVKDLYFGNTAGKDFLAGKDVAVVGTPAVPPIVYALWASCLNIPFTMNDFIEETPNRDGGMKYQNIIHNGYSYWSFTFNNPLLRELQIFLISQEIYQAVGRSRSLRFDCKTVCFTNIPIEGAVIH